MFYNNLGSYAFNFRFTIPLLVFLHPSLPPLSPEPLVENHQSWQVVQHSLMVQLSVFASFNIYMLIFGRVSLGVRVGFANQSVSLYLSEMAPPRYIGAINNCFKLSVGIGALSANLINYNTQNLRGGYRWRISLALVVVPASILTLGALFLPETPNKLFFW